MKKSLYPICLLLVAVSLSGCLEEVCEENRIVQAFEPIVINADEWRQSEFFCGVGQPVCEATNFYVYEQYLFMMEGSSGLHILDNSDPTNPVPVTFMEAPGGQGLAVRNGILYMNQYTDLVAFDLNNPEKPELVGRTEDVFEPYSVFAQVLPGDQFVVDWIETSERRNVSCESENFNREIFFQDGLLFANSSADLESSFANSTSQGGGGSPETVGQGGSLARFTITSGMLYAVDDTRLRAFDLSNAEQPQFIQAIELGWGIETIFPQGDKLYIGSQTGMQIFSIADPLNPEHLSTFEHVQSCDPVVVDGDLAYVTLWGGRDCGSIGDQLEIIDVSDARNPQLLQTVPMTSSHGLGVAEGKLFLCSRWEGFRIFDLDDNGLLGEEIEHVENIIAQDVIVRPGTNDLIILGLGQEGIWQYGYTDEGEMSRKSHISVCD
jgi:hypothetical protein